jgi:hypothetical protein
MANSDYYLSKEDCDKASREFKNSNPRYRNFCQKYFTAGDEEQFQKARDWSNSSQTNEVECQTQFKFDIWNGYHGACGDTITNTFAYLFHKFKKGIYVRIKDNKIVTFLPFSKAKFVNEWSEKIRVHPKYKNTIDFFRHINDMEGRHFNEHRVNKFTDEWYANNCLVRYEFPLSEGDTGTSHIKNMLEELCKNRHVPNLEFFVNRRDFPLLKRDFTEPYDHMFDSDTVPLLSHKYEKYAPIFSSVAKDNFADLAMPTIDDWARVKSSDGAFFEKTQNRSYSGDFSTLWSERQPIAIFRGGSTGVGTTIETNPRLKAAYLSFMGEKDNDGLPYLDAGITDWNLRPRKMKGEKYLQTIDIKNMPFSLVPKLSPEEQCKYRYILHIQGHVSAFRLSLELSMGSTILLVESEYHLWFFHLLQPYVHYVPVKSDLSNLIDQIKWCKRNDEQCQKIAENALHFFKKYLTKDGIFNYLQSLLVQTKKAVGTFVYPEKTPTRVNLENECKFVKEHCIYNLPVEKKKLLISTKNTQVYDCGGKVIKYSKDKEEELFRDVYIFKKGCIEGSPNFVNIYGIVEDGGVVMDKHDGMTLFDWLKKEYDETEFLSILSQLALSIYIVQTKSGFVHNDLMPWNIIIQKKKETFVPTFTIFDRVYQLRPTCVYPVIIDYGKAHIVVDDRHHGLINPFEMNALRDLCMLIFSSVSVLICLKKGEKSFLRSKEEQFLIDLVNFFCPPIKFHSFTKMRHYIATHSSFSILTSMAVDDSKNNLNFIDYIYRIRHDCFSITDLRLVYPPQHRVKKPLPKLNFKNRLLVYHFFQSLNDPQFEKEFKLYLETVADKSDCTPIVKPFQIDNEMYLNKDKILRMKGSLSQKVDQKLVNEKMLVSLVLSYKGVYEVSVEDKEKIINYYAKVDPFCIIHHFANMYTMTDFILLF